MCGVVRYSVFYSRLLVLFFFGLHSLLRRGSSGLCVFSFFRVVMVSLSFCISSLRPIVVGVGFGWAHFWVSGVFVVCVSACLLVWMGEERTVEAVSCSAVCTNFQTVSAPC